MLPVRRRLKLLATTAAHAQRLDARAAVLAAITLVVAMTLAGCQSHSTQHITGPAPNAQQIVHLPLLAWQPLTLDPAFMTASDSASAQVGSLIYPSLMALDSTMTTHPWAAESVNISADSRALTFTLRGSLQFSDGEPITAQTFAYSLNRALDPCVAAPDVAPLLMLAGAAAYHAQTCDNPAVDLTGPITTLIGPGMAIQVIDSLTLTLRLEHPWVGALAALATPVADAIPQTLAQSYGANNGLGSQWTAHLTDHGGLGGSLFRVTTLSGSALTLTRNPSFWGTAATLREIDFSTYTSTTSEWNDYQAGKLDLGYPPPSAIQAANVQSQPLLSLTYLGLNWSVAPLDNLGLRQALALAIDKRSLAETTLGGQAQPTNHLLPQGEPGYNAALIGPAQTQDVTGNTATAVNLAQAYASQSCNAQLADCPRLTLEVASEDSAGQALAAAIARMWQVVAPGYPLHVQQEPAATLMARITSGAAQLYLTTWRPAYADPSAWLDAAFGPNAASANASAATADVQTLLTEGEVEQDPTQRAQDYQAAEQLLVSNVAWIPLVQPYVFWQTRSNVANLTLDAWGALAVYNTAPSIEVTQITA